MSNFLFFLFASLPILFFGQILEVKTFDEVMPHIKDHSLVLLDLDNTLMETAQELGNDQWFRHRVKIHTEAGINKAQAIDNAVSEWMSVQCVSPMKLVEPEIDAKIAHIQQRGIDVMGLTTRSQGMSTRTISQLASIGIDLHKNAPHTDEVFFENGPNCLFTGGVLFTSNSHKGEAFEKFLTHTQIKPKHIVFVNDKHSHIVPVKEKCEELGIPFIGLRYGYLDDKVENFDPSVSQMQWEHFNFILSDQQATQMLSMSQDD